MLSIDRIALKDIARENSTIKPGCKIRASNDVEALERWLDEYFDKATTFRSYKKEGERFLVWCVKKQNCKLADLMRDDVEAYVNFLKDPQPKEIWCGPRRKKASEQNSQWHPFTGPLSPAAIKTAVAVLTSFLSFLVDANYLNHNPFALIRRKSRFKHNFDDNKIAVHERILSDEEWRAMTKTLREKNDHREIFIVSVLYFLGLRIEELANARWHDCKKINGKWWFFVCGKNDRLGKIPINSELLSAIMRYRHQENLAPMPALDEDRPLIANPHTKNNLTSRHISNIIKAIAVRAAEEFAPNSISHAKLKRLSPHWLRHLSASRQDLAGISFTNIKSNLRHENEQTTRIYVHAFDDERHREMEKLRL